MSLMVIMLRTKRLIRTMAGPSGRSLESFWRFLVCLICAKVSILFDRLFDLILGQLDGANSRQICNKNKGCRKYYKREKERFIKLPGLVLLNGREKNVLESSSH